MLMMKQCTTLPNVYGKIEVQREYKITCGTRGLLMSLYNFVYIYIFNILYLFVDTYNLLYYTIETIYLLLS